MFFHTVLNFNVKDGRQRYAKSHTRHQPLAKNHYLYPVNQLYTQHYGTKSANTGKEDTVNKGRSVETDEGKQNLQTQEKKTPLTKEEVWRRMREHKRKKQELLEQIQQEMRARIKERTGEDVTSFEVW